MCVLVQKSVFPYYKSKSSTSFSHFPCSSSILPPSLFPSSSPLLPLSLSSPLHPLLPPPFLSPLLPYPPPPLYSPQLLSVSMADLNECDSSDQYLHHTVYMYSGHVGERRHPRL